MEPKKLFGIVFLINVNDCVWKVSAEEEPVHCQPKRKQRDHSRKECNDLASYRVKRTLTFFKQVQESTEHNHVDKPDSSHHKAQEKLWNLRQKPVTELKMVGSIHGKTYYVKYK